MVPEREGASKAEIHVNSQQDFNLHGGVEFSSRNTETRYLPKQEREEFALEVNTVLSGVDKYLLQSSDNKVFIIDMYNIPPVETAPISPQDGVKQMRELAVKIDEKKDRLPAEWEVKRDELIAASTYLEEREKPFSQRMPYAECLRTISGFYPQEIPIPVLEADRKRLASLLRNAGYPNANGDVEGLRQAYQEYHSRKLIYNVDSLKNGLTSGYYSFRAKLASALRRPNIYGTSFDIRIVEAEAPFMAWERILPEGKFLDINYFESKRSQWGWEEVERYARHEGAHFVMGDIQANEIRAGRLDSIAGYLLIPGPACWAMEGVAQTIDDLTGIQSGEDGRISIAAYRMFIRARNNVLYQLEYGFKTMQEGIQYMERYAPQKSSEEIERELVQGTQDPMWRPYLPVYGHSDWKIINLAERLSAEGRKEVLNQLMTRTWTYEQFNKDYGQLAAKTQTFV